MGSLANLTASIEATRGVLRTDAYEATPSPRKLNHDEARSLITLYRHHDAKSSIAAIPLHLVTDWVILEYPDGTHVAFNAEGW